MLTVCHGRLSDHKVRVKAAPKSTLSHFLAMEFGANCVYSVTLKYLFCEMRETILTSQSIVRIVFIKCL